VQFILIVILNGVF